MIVGDHDRLCGPRPHDPTGVVEHGEVEMEPYLLPMMAAVTGNPQRQYHRTRREVKYLRAVELQDIGSIFMLALPWYDRWFLLRVRVGACGPYTCGNLACNALGLDTG